MDHCSADGTQECSGQAEPLRPQNCDVFDVNWSDIVLTGLELYRDNEKSLQDGELDHGDAGSGLQSDAVS